MAVTLDFELAARLHLDRRSVETFDPPRAVALLERALEGSWEDLARTELLLSFALHLAGESDRSRAALERAVTLAAAEDGGIAALHAGTRALTPDGSPEAERAWQAQVRAALDDR